MSNSLISCALSIAMDAHADQKDLAGKPYITHPLRVALSLETPCERVVALLHDVIEDGGLDAYDLRTPFPPHIVDAVVTLTRKTGESYSAYIERVAGNPLARTVKLADLRDNLDPARSAALPDRLKRRYLSAWKRLTGQPFPRVR